MRVAVAGNYSLDPGSVAHHLLLEAGGGGLGRLPADSVVLLRCPLEGHPGPVESIAARLCETLDIAVEWRVPPPGQGRAGIRFRDIHMVDDADEVIAYFHPDHIMDEETGTGFLIQRALDIPKPVYAYAPRQTDVEWVGEVTDAKVDPVFFGRGVAHQAARRGDIPRRPPSEVLRP